MSGPGFGGSFMGHGVSPLRPPLRGLTDNPTKGYASQDNFLNLNYDDAKQEFCSNYAIDADDRGFQAAADADVATTSSIDDSPHESTFEPSREQNKLTATAENLLCAQNAVVQMRSHYGNSKSSAQALRCAANGLNPEENYSVILADMLIGLFPDMTEAPVEAILAKDIWLLVQYMIIVEVRKAAAEQSNAPRRSMRLAPKTPTKSESKSEDQGGLQNSTARGTDTTPKNDENIAKSELIIQWIMNCRTKYKERPPPPPGCEDIIEIITKIIRDECAIWTGVHSPEDIQGIKDDTHIYRLVNFLTVVAGRELNKFAEYHRFSDSVTDQVHVKRFQRVGTSRIFTNSHIRQVLSAAAAECGIIAGQLFREDTSKVMICVLDEERRRNEFNSGPMGCALGIGIGFAGFGRAIVELHSGKITTAAIHELMQEMNTVTREPGETILSVIRRVWEIFHKASRAEKQLPPSSRPLHAAIMAGHIAIDDVVASTWLRTPDEDGKPRSQQENFILGELTREFKQRVAQVTKNVTSMVEHDSQIESLSLEISRQIDSQSRSLRCLNSWSSRSEDSSPSPLSNKADQNIQSYASATSTRHDKKQHRGHQHRHGKASPHRGHRDYNEENYANLSVAQTTGHDHDHPTADSVISGSDIGLDGKRHTAAFFDSEGGSKCAYCGCHDPTKTYFGGRPGVPHDKQHCLVEAYDRSKGRLGEHGCPEYRQIATERGAKHITYPSSRTQQIPSTMPIAGTLDEVHRLRKTGMIPTSTKYEGPASKPIKSKPIGEGVLDKTFAELENNPGLVAEIQKQLAHIAATVTEQGDRTNQRFDELYDATGLSDLQQEEEEANATYADENQNME